MSTVSLKSYNKLLDPSVQNHIKAKVTIDRTHDVPFVAGYSKDGKTIYIDRHFIKMLDGIDIEPFVILHEKVEKSLIDKFDMHYIEAHKLATHVEKQHVGSLWKKYNKFVMNQYKHIHHEKLQKLPNDLDLTPYKDEKNYNVLVSLTNRVSSKKS